MRLPIGVLLRLRMTLGHSMALGRSLGLGCALHLLLVRLVHLLLPLLHLHVQRCLGAGS